MSDITAFTTALTMNSKEIAELVEKRHDNVRRTIETLVEQGVILKPQIEVLEEISNLGLPIQREADVFTVDRKRDTYIVVAQLSPVFTARIVDRWQELEQKQAQPTQKPGYLLAAELAPTYVAAAEAFRIKGNQAVLAANQAITKITAFNLLEAMGQTHLVAPHNEPLLTPSDIAGRMGVGVRAVNPMLIDCGLQEDHRDHKNRLYYELTDFGEQYGVYQDTSKKHGDGTPIRQIKWRSGVLSVLEARTQVEHADGETV